MEIEEQEITKWKDIRLKLNQQYIYDKEWGKAIILFNQRFTRKYFDPIQQLIDEGKLKGEGFTILTVQCALIEAFASLRSGEIFDHTKNTGSPKYTYKNSQKIFTKFLQSAAIFKNIFWVDDSASSGQTIPDKPFSAESFYKDVRCGLMHEARTKGKWIINAAPLRFKTKTEKIFIEHENGKNKIYRTILHYRLKRHLADYTSDLKKTGSEGEILRRFFARKMDHIFEEVADGTKFEWWIDK
ncbi:hypothetical protein KXQ82_10675 [Mucilaginibacter sp. HMF5004]|uniref:hypothetical protein n=1 Tax=Mucilaginibacter rivuli TaxID=2857527 RepID=UPI001C600BAE|nr:hypothetical protein [Mucilaginibacter rivuli]MBW4890184.1 hypothetical protein [Mucilaginibacter rivuli]